MRQRSLRIDKNDCGAFRHPYGRNNDMNMDSEFGQHIPFFFTREGSAIDLVGQYKGRSAFLICNGPSFVKLNRNLLNEPGVMTFGINNGPKTFRPNFWTCVDDPVRFMKSIWLDPKITKFIPQAHFEKPIFDNEKWEVMNKKVGDCPNVIGYRRNEKFHAERWMKEETLNWGNSKHDGGGRSVMLPSLRLLHLLGFRKVYLLGCDMKMTANYAYHFDEQRSAGAVSCNNSTYDRLKSEYLPSLKPIFDAAGYRVFNCFPSETEILTFNGWKPIGQAQINDSVATMEIGTRKLIYQPVLELFKQNYTGSMVKFREDFPIATPNHRMLTLMCDSGKNHKATYGAKYLDKIIPEFRFAKDLRPGLRMMGNFVCDNKTETKTEECSPFPDKISAEDWCEFMGWYLSEGSCEGTKSGNIRNYVIAISQHNGHKKDELRQLLGRTKWNWRESDVCFRLNNKELHKYLFVLGTSYTKYIPRNIFNYSNDCLEKMWRSLLMGDGDIRNGRYITTSERLANDVQELLIRLGYIASIAKWNCSKKRHIWGHIPKDQYCVHALGKKYYKIENLSNVVYNGEVACVRVKNGTIVIRHPLHKLPLVTGNCNPESELKVFPFVNFEDAIKEATSELGDVKNERVWGMYSTPDEKPKWKQEPTKELKPHLQTLEMLANGMSVNVPPVPVKPAKVKNPNIPPAPIQHPIPQAPVNIIRPFANNPHAAIPKFAECVGGTMARNTPPIVNDNPPPDIEVDREDECEERCNIVVENIPPVRVIPQAPIAPQAVKSNNVQQMTRPPMVMPAPVVPPTPIRWNPFNKVVQDHRNGTIDLTLTNQERAKRGLRTPWTPAIGEKEVMEPAIE